MKIDLTNDNVVLHFRYLITIKKKEEFFHFFQNHFLTKYCVRQGIFIVHFEDQDKTNTNLYVLIKIQADKGVNQASKVRAPKKWVNPTPYVKKIMSYVKKYIF